MKAKDIKIGEVYAAHRYIGDPAFPLRITKVAKSRVFQGVRSSHGGDVRVFGERLNPDDLTAAMGVISIRGLSLTKILEPWDAPAWATSQQAKADREETIRRDKAAATLLVNALGEHGIGATGGDKGVTIYPNTYAALAELLGVKLEE